MKKLTGKEIIELILRELDIKAPTFSANIKVDYTRIYDLQRGKTKKISSEVANSIIENYPQFNLSWLLTGDGDMLLSDEKETDSLAGNNDFIEYLKSDIKDLKEKNEKLIEKNEKLIKDNNYFRGLLEKHGIDYSKTAM